MATTYEQLAYREIPGQKEKEVYNPTTGKAYGTPEQLAADLGKTPAEIDWSEIGKGMNAENLGQGALQIPTPPAYSPTNAVNFWQTTAAGLKPQMETIQKNLEQANANLTAQPQVPMTDILSQQYEKWGVSGMFDQIKTWTEEANAVRQNIATLQDQENQALLNAEGQRVSLATIKGRQSIIARQYDSKIAAESARLSGYGAMIEAVRGNLSTAQSFANEFVQAATYDYQVKRDTLQQFYNYNKDMFSYLGSQYESAIKNMVDAADKEYQRQYNEKQQVAQLMLEYPTAGITYGDTLEQALQKAKSAAAQKWNLEMSQTGTSGKYETELKNEIDKLYSGSYGIEGAREKVIAKLKAKFPNIDVAKDIYSRVPDGYEKNISTLREKTILTQGQLTKLAIAEVPNDIANWIQQNLNAGNSLDFIRNDLATQLGDKDLAFGYVDRFMKTMQTSQAEDLLSILQGLEK